MAHPVKLADDIIAAVRKESALQGRTAAEQITHWLRIGRAIEGSKGFDYRRIGAALEASLSPDELNPPEQEVWFDLFTTKMAEATKHEKYTHAKRRRLGRGVGISRSGELIYEGQIA